jgi:hypothetical protein
MDDMKRLEAMIKLIKRSGFLVKGSMEMLPNGCVRIRPTIGGSLGKNCPYCGMAKIKTKRGDSLDAMIEGDDHVWTAHSCLCLSCLKSYLRLINEIGEQMAICKILQV